MTYNNKYDVVVIGAGPAGYVAAIRCSQLGLKTACIDNWQDKNGKHRPGGTCLNAGCIPSKALLDSSQRFYQVNNELAEHGIKVNKASLNIAQMMARKDNIVHQLSSGISSLLQANNIDLHHGSGQLQENNQIEVMPVDAEAKRYIIEGKNIILATGSQAMNIPAAPIDNHKIVDSTGALSFKEVPKRLAIIGAGVIGLELGSVWNRLGTKVILLEAREDFLPIADRLLASEALRHFISQGLDIRLGARVTSSSIGKKQITVSYQDKQEQKRIVVDRVLVAVGRIPQTKKLFAANVNLLLDEGGGIDVDKYCRTNLPNVYAIGDIVRGPMLAHKGSEEGMSVAETIAGNKNHLNMNLIPAVIYTLPEIAWVGKTEQALLKEDIPFNTGIFPFAANGRAKTMSADTGQVKILSHAETDKILGVHIIGPFASEVLQTAVIAMEFDGSAEDLARSVFAHPSLSEAVHEAALAVDDRAIHVINRV